MSVDLSPLADIIEEGGHARGDYFGEADEGQSIDRPVECCAIGALALHAARSHADARYGAARTVAQARAWVVPIVLDAISDIMVGRIFDPVPIRVYRRELYDFVRPLAEQLVRLADHDAISTWSDGLSTADLLAALRGTS